MIYIYFSDLKSKFNLVGHSRVCVCVCVRACVPVNGENNNSKMHIRYYRVYFSL